MGDASIQAAMIQGIRKRIPEVNIIGITLNPGDTASRHGIPTFGLHHYSPETDGFPDVDPDASEKNEQVPSGKGEKTVNQTHDGRQSGFARNLDVLARSVLRLLWHARQEYLHILSARKILEKVDMLVVSGGGQIDDSWGGTWAHPYALWKWTLLARMCGARVLFVSVGAGPLHSPISRLFVRGAIRRSEYVSYRDEYSKIFMEGVNSKKNSFVAPDLAHSLRVKCLVPPYEYQGRSRVVGIGPIPYCDPDSWPEKDEIENKKYVRKLVELSKELLQKGYAVEFISCEINMDRKTIRRIMELLGLHEGNQDKRVSFPVITTHEELIEVLHGVDIVITSRFHGVLLALLLKKPVIGLSYHRKIDELLIDAGCRENIFDIKTFTVPSLLGALEHLMDNIPAEGSKIAKRESEFLVALEKQYDKLFGTVTNR